ncbi:MAG: hypothetical protein NT109_05360 [Flavobacteriia bacterium]|nr:hypothetical protein [Flavobacteriia bacterium]
MAITRLPESGSYIQQYDPVGRVIPPSRYNRPWRSLDWRNSIEVSGK